MCESKQEMDMKKRRNLTLSEEAQKVAAEYKNLSCTVFGHERAQELGMGSFLSVAKGSEHEGKFVILEYKAADSTAPTIALCGKGVTFDTGGISLKPSSSMDGMKYDMAGAASVIMLMKFFAQLKPNVNVIGITPLVENMPSGRASRQDDIVVAMNGKSIEIKSTDVVSFYIFIRNASQIISCPVIRSVILNS